MFSLNIQVLFMNKYHHKMVSFLRDVTWCWPFANLMSFCHLLVKTDCPVLTMITDYMNLNSSTLENEAPKTKIVFVISNIKYLKSCCLKNLSSHNCCQLERCCTDADPDL